MVGKRVEFDDETWEASWPLLAKGGGPFSNLPTRLFGDLLRRYGQPVGLMASLKENIRTRAEAHMKYVLATIICLVLVGTTPALSAPPWVEDYCWAQAAQVRFSGRGEREAFIARCIADLTPTPSEKRRKYKKPRY